MPQLNELLKIIRTVPGVLAATLFLLWLLRRREILTQPRARNFLLVTCATTHVALTVVAMSLFALTPNMVQIANYLQPLVVAGFFAFLAAARTAMPSMTKLCAMFLVLAGLVSIRAIGMSTWGVACARDVSYSTAIQRVRHEMSAVPAGGAVVVSSAYLYEAARRPDVRWIHSDWPGKTEFTNPNWERDALIVLKPASLIITQFDYFRRYDAVLAALQRDGLVQFELQNTALLPAPDSLPSLQKVVQHIAWAPVVVRFSWSSEN